MALQPHPSSRDHPEQTSAPPSLMASAPSFTPSPAPNAPVQTQTFPPSGLKFLLSLVFICLCLGRGDQAQIYRVAEEAPAWPVAQEVHVVAQRPLLQTHACILESVVIQPPAFTNELSELVKFILNEACQVNPPASVSLNDNSIFPLFPWLISSKKWHNLLRVSQADVFSLKPTDAAWGISAWMEICQSYKHLKTGFCNGKQNFKPHNWRYCYRYAIQKQLFSIHARGSVLAVPCSDICGSKSGDIPPRSALQTRWHLWAGTVQGREGKEHFPPSSLLDWSCQMKTSWRGAGEAQGRSRASFDTG